MDSKAENERKILHWQDLIDKCNQDKILLLLYNKFGIFEMLNDAVVNCRLAKSDDEVVRLICLYERSIRRAVHVHLAFWISEVALIHVAWAWMSYWLILLAFLFYYVLFIRMLN